jgi:TonB-linked SusC/RagA family outer membrane protein
MKQLSLMVMMLLLTAQIALAQRTVVGKVTGNDGEALIDATVLVKGLTIGTTTDVDGNYSLDVPAGSNTLVISYVGYTDREVVLGSSNVVNVTLEGTAEMLDEMVVTALGVSRSQKTLGYAVDEVSGEDLTATKNLSPLDALNGKVPGLTISTGSGAPGASTTVNIRGFNSVTGNNQPLFVIDGVPMNNRGNTSSSNALTGNDFSRSMDFGNQMNDINPDDIESISVLKGSAASALYGSRAANGVILITTKKGKQGKIKVDFNTSYSQQDLLRLPHLQNTYGQGWSGLFAYEENGSWGPKTDGMTRLWGNVVNNSQQLKPFTAQENNLRDFFELGKAFTTGIAFGAGNDNSNYRFSYSLATADGVVPTDADSYKRNTFGFTGGTKFNKLSVNSSINYVNKNQKAVATGQGDDSGAGNVVWQEIIQMPRDHSIVDYEKLFDENDPARDFYNLDNFFTPYAQNPYWTLYNQGNKYTEDRVFGNLELGYDIVDGLKAVWRGGLDNANAFQKDWGNLGIISDGSYNSSANDVVGAVTEMTRNNSQYNSDLFLSYSKDLNDQFDISALVGHNINQRGGKTLISRVTNLVIPDYFSLKNSTAAPTTVATESLRRLVGVYGSVSVGFQKWLYLSLGARNDWSSTLPKGNNSYFYPSVSLSGVLSDAFTMPKAITYLKVRTGYARTGNDTDPYKITPVYLPGTSNMGFGSTAFPFGGVNAYELSNDAGNQDLRPELTGEIEFGLEAKFLSNRLGIDATYFNRTTDDQIVDLQLDAASGFTTQPTNLGKVSNKGIELALDLIPVRTKLVEWGLNYNFTKIKNEVLSLGTSDATSILLNSSYDVDMRAEVGKPLGAIYAPQEATDPNGNIIVNPATGLPITADEKEYKGSINPDYTMGLGTYVKVWDFTLGGNADFRKGGVFYSYTARLNYFVGHSWNTQYNDREPWIIPNSVIDLGEGNYAENTTPISRANVFTYYGATDSYQNHHVLDRTFFKLRNLYLNYDLPSKLANQAKLEKATIGIFGRNLVLWTPADNHFVDPESNTFGTDLQSLYGEFATGPSTATYGIQLNLTF